MKEARKLVPDLLSSVPMREIREHLDRYRDESAWTSRDVDRGGSAMSSTADHFSLVGEITSHLRYFQTNSVLVRDLPTGLVGFPLIRYGRMVFL